MRRLALASVVVSMGTGFAACGSVGDSGGEVINPQGEDVKAQTAVRLTQTALETYYVEHASYEGASSASLAQLAPEVSGSNVTVTTTANTYELSAESASGNRFTASRDPNGVTTLSCETRGEAGCPDSGQW